ncbi:type IV pilus modification PilV family protein [Leucobacter sp.]
MPDQEAQRVVRDRGFSMVEIVISMFLLGILSLAVLPLVMRVTQHSVENRGLLEATAFAKDELARIEADYPATPGTVATSCAVLTARAANPPAVHPENGTEAVLTVGSCPGVYPGSVPVKISVVDGGDTVTSVTSRVRVGSA